MFGGVLRQHPAAPPCLWQCLQECCAELGRGRAVNLACAHIAQCGVFGWLHCRASCCVNWLQLFRMPTHRLFNTDLNTPAPHTPQECACCTMWALLCHTGHNKQQLSGSMFVKQLWHTRHPEAGPGRSTIAVHQPPNSPLPSRGLTSSHVCAPVM